MALNDTPSAQNFREFGAILVIFEFFGQKTGFSPQRVARRALP